MDEQPQQNAQLQATKTVQDIVIGVVVVLFIGFAGCFIAATAMLVDSFNSKAASYQALETQVQAQNAKMDLLIQEYGKK